jgi:homoserine dehydrogenase
MSVAITTVERADAFCTTGNSPGRRAATHTTTPAPTTRRHTAPVASVHLLGPGAVGSALLRKLPHGCILTGVTDSTATLRGRGGLDPHWIAAIKRRGRSLAGEPGARALELAAALAWVDADVVVDATATDFRRAGWADTLHRAVLGSGRALVLAAKDALCRNAHVWLGDETRTGCNAVLGGTGRLLQRELGALRTTCAGVAIAGNASTTAILAAVERGGTVEDGIAEAAARGFLEADRELDLRGADAAAKLAIVAGALSGRAIDPASIGCDDIRTIDSALIRARVHRGCTTRLVARADACGALAVRYEEIPRGSPLAAPIGRVIYAYALADGTTRVHVGAGLGAEATAHAALADLAAFVADRTTPSAAVPRAGNGAAPVTFTRAAVRSPDGGAR